MQKIILNSSQSITDVVVTANSTTVPNSVTLQYLLENIPEFFYGCDGDSDNVPSCQNSITEITLTTGSVTFDAFVGGRPTKPPVA